LQQLGHGGGEFQCKKELVEGGGSHCAFYRAGGGEERAGCEGEQWPMAVEFKCDDVDGF
jgi:hypothetical protein